MGSLAFPSSAQRQRLSLYNRQRRRLQGVFYELKGPGNGEERFTA